jgi:hypothetical protein
MSSRRALWVSVSWFACGLLAGCGITVPGGFELGIDPATAAGSGGSRPPVAGIGGGVAGRGGAAGGIAGTWGGTSGAGVAGTWSGGYAGTWSGSAGAGIAGTWGGGYAGTWGGYAGTGVAGTWGGYAGTGAAGAGSWYDNDGDGYSQANDCDDFNYYVHPGAMDACCDFFDTDCDGSDAPAGAACKCAGPTEPPPRYVDRDGDGWSEADGDCNDYDASAFPGAPA